MLGTSRTVRGGKLIAFEFLRVVERDGGWVYVAQPGGAPPTECVLTEWGGTRAFRTLALVSVKSGEGHLRYFRTFHQVYAERMPEIRHIASGESAVKPIRHTISGGRYGVRLRW
jgi:hypothetical protein